MNLPEEVRVSEDRIRPFIRETPLEYSLFLSQLGGANVYLKCENLQHTGSFKARGAMNRLLALSPLDRERGVVAASTGNHGAAVARSAAELGMPAIVYVPEDASPSKLDNIRRRGAEVRYHGNDCVIAETFARAYAEEHGLSYVSGYNDAHVVAGQGTIGVELERQLDHIDAVFVALGGGGLISGIAGYLKSVHPEVTVVGCSPENSKVMMESVRAGKILDLPSLPTLSDGSAGGVEPGSITFEWCRELIDEFVSVTEEEIAETLRTFIETHHMLIEGAAAVAVAGYLVMQERFKGKNVVIVLCGANIALETLRDVLGGTA
jgi:threonine dehydratase